MPRPSSTDCASATPTSTPRSAYENPWQLLVVTVLSAQTTDENVNRTAPALFARYPTPQALAEADPEEVERLVYSTGFYRQKTESIIALSVDLGGASPWRGAGIAR